MMRTGVRTLLVLITLASTAAAHAQDRGVIDEDIAVCDALQITGTFSDLRFDEQRERLVGAEVRIVVTENGYQASVQFAGERLSDLFVADVDFNVDLTYWPLGVPLPEREPDTDSFEMRIQSGPYAGTFAGTISRTHLKGDLKLVSGDRISLDLPRTKGHWD